MFGFITDAVETSLDILAGISEGELPTNQEVATLISAGVSVAAIAASTGFTVDVIQELIND